MEEEIKRLEKIIAKIDMSKRFDTYFDEMYELMQREYPDLDVRKANIFKEARVYIGQKEKHPKDSRGNMTNYLEFLSEFRSHISDKIQRVKHKPNTTTE